MFRNILLTSLRNILRNRLVSVINLLGLGTGAGVFLLVMLFVSHEYRMDGFIGDSDRIYRIEYGNWALLGPGFASMAQEICPEVEEAVSVRTYLFNNLLVEKDDGEKTIIDNYLPVTENFIGFFGFRIISGDKANPLDDPFSLVLTESEALRLYGTEDPVGKTINFYDQPLTVRAVMEDPLHFHLPFNALVSFGIQEIIFDHGDWRSQFLTDMNNPTYVKLFSGSYERDVEKRITTHIAELYQSHQIEDFSLRPVADIYFRGALPFEGPVRHGNLQFIGIMIMVAVLILVLAGINYTNLSTARAALRAREIGIRKVNGSSRTLIILQFLLESVVTATFSMIVALAFIELAGPVFDTLVERQTGIAFTPNILAIIILLPFAVGILSGLYPALYLSSCNPAKIIKGNSPGGTGGSWFRKGLIIFQFSVSAGLIIVTLIISSQLKYFANYDTGLDKDQVLNMGIPRQASYDYDVFRERILQIPGISGISRSNSKPGSVQWQESFTDIDGNSYNFSFLPVDPDYLDLFRIELAEGRGFSWDRPGDIRETIIINETLAGMTGYEEPVGMKLPGGYADAIIIGVVKDFNFNSLHSDIGPLGLSFRNSGYNTFNIKIDTSDTRDILNEIEKVWHDYAPDEPFNYSWLEESFNRNYRSEMLMVSMFGYLSLLAIIIAGMGLFGLAAFILQSRMKEMSIRKVLGASSFSIIKLLAREFSVLVVISNVIAWPVAWYSMNNWLSNFAHRTQVSWYFFILSLFLTLLIALLTVTWHSWQAARSNPVKTLKYE